MLIYFHYHKKYEVLRKWQKNLCCIWYVFIRIDGEIIKETFWRVKEKFREGKQYYFFLNPVKIWRADSSQIVYSKLYTNTFSLNNITFIGTRKSLKRNNGIIPTCLHTWFILSTLSERETLWNCKLITRGSAVNPRIPTWLLLIKSGWFWRVFPLSG